MVPIIAPQKRTLLHIAVLQVFWQRSLQSQSIIWPDTPSPCRSLLFILHPFLEVHRHSVFVCLFLDESTVSIVELSVPGIDQKKEEWACPGCKGRGQTLEGGAWLSRAGPVMEGGAWPRWAGARWRPTLVSLISSRAPEVAVLRGGAPGRPAQGAGQVCSSPGAAALSGGRGEYRPRLPRLWAAAGPLRRALRDGTQPGAALP